MRQILIAAALFALSACATTKRLQPSADVAAGTTRAQVVATHGTPTSAATEQRDGHEVETLLYTAGGASRVVCLVDGVAVHSERTSLMPEFACYAWPRPPSIAGR